MNTLLPLLSLVPAALFAVSAEALQAKSKSLVGKAVAVGDFSVLPLLDREHSFPLNLFHGTDEAAILAMAGGPQAAGSFNVFLLAHGQERFLVDAGNGTLRPERQGQLPLCLQAAGTAPENISNIFITHAHSDHIGGLVKDGKPAFPRAQVHMPRAEYDYWMDDEAMRQAPENVGSMFTLARGVLRLLEDGKLLRLFTPGETLAAGITSVAIFGHTMGHTGYMLTSRGKKIFFVGDLLHAEAIQFARPDISLVFDADQSMAAETRRRALKQVASEAIPIAATHLPFPGIGLVRLAGCGYSFEVFK
ncbi:MAG: MBL fold metallo-hydrolase [Desulfobulbaceae bacterium]|jgi:glyoxylase-like metal-dependent hydrolase (beta-lactamase superfamily II)|nr:MBL fold metallo-hydrolase [Desulfobulbaceae bacterium]